MDERSAYDFTEGILNYKLWGRLGLQEVRRRYRRTVLGPFWASLSMAIFISALGFLYAKLWGQDPAEYLPFLTTGFLAWIPMAAVIGESATVIVAAGGLCSQMRLPYTFFTVTMVWRNVIAMMHHTVVYIGVILIFPVELTESILLVPIGVLFLAVNGIWIGLMLGSLCLRFRDVQPLVTNFLQILLFVTPIFWPPTLLGERGFAFINANPFYHFVSTIRDPLIGNTPSMFSYYYLIGVTILGWLLTFIVFPRIRPKLAYWQ
jgi:ABC-type polysaccharide/polyol phosphate export permease